MRTSGGTRFLRPVVLIIAAAALIALGACGGGGSGGAAGSSSAAGATTGAVTATGGGTTTATGTTSGAGAVTATGLTTGTVAMLLTDAPPASAAFCQILATIERIDLLGAGTPATVYTGPVTVNLLAMRNYSDVFAVDAAVPVGTYDKVRLTLSDLALVECDASGTPEPASGWDHPKLPGNGKLDLIPRDSFQVVGGETVIVQLDLDMAKSLFVHQTGNGKWQFRPVIFVTITPDNSKLVRVFGQVRALNGATFELCPLTPVPTLLSGTSSVAGGNTGGECLDVFTDVNTSIFDASGSPVGLASVANGDLLTAIGLLSPHDAEGDGRPDDLRLDAVVLELGPFGTFLRIAGTVASTPGHNDIFVFGPTVAPTPYSNGAAAIDVLLQSGTKIFAIGSSSELTSAALQPGASGEVNGVFTDPATAGQPLKSSLIVLDKDATPTRALLSAVVDTTDPKTGRLTVIGSDKTGHCVLTSLTAPATLYLLVIESPSSTAIKVIAFGDLLSGDVVDVYGHDDPGGSSCIAADTIQDYGPIAAPK